MAEECGAKTAIRKLKAITHQQTVCNLTEARHEARQCHCQCSGNTIRLGFGLQVSVLACVIEEGGGLPAIAQDTVLDLRGRADNDVGEDLLRAELSALLGGLRAVEPQRLQARLELAQAA